MKPGSVRPLGRNRDFVLLQAGQLLSNAGTQTTAIAYPLLVLALTQSPARAGLVSFTRTLPAALFALPAGVLADRFGRRRLMIAADCVRAAVVAALAAVIALGSLAFWELPVAAFVEGVGATVFAAAQVGALRAVVPLQQLPAAAGAETGRNAVVGLAGPPLGGALFEVSRALPFFVDAASYGFSTVSLLAMRTPFEKTADRESEPLGRRLAEGFHFVWGHAFLRTTALLFGLANFIGPGLLLVVVVVGRDQGLTGGQIGLLVTAFAVCLLLGSMLSPLSRRLLPVHAIMLLELWTWPACVVFLIWPNVYVLTAALLPTALVIPSTDSVVHGFRIAITPDRLLGRAESVRRTISLAVAPLGPLAAGVLLGAGSARLAVGCFAAAALVLAVWGTLSPAIRAAPSLDELEPTV